MYTSWTFIIHDTSIFNNNVCEVQGLPLKDFQRTKRSNLTKNKESHVSNDNHGSSQIKWMNVKKETYWLKKILFPTQR